MKVKVTKTITSGDKSWHVEVEAEPTDICFEPNYTSESQQARDLARSLFESLPPYQSEKGE